MAKTKKLFGICLDGGGVGGVGVGAFFEVMKDAIPRPSFYGGTSVGAIISAYLAFGGDFGKVKQLVLEGIPIIFKKPPFWNLKYSSLTCRYPNDNAIKFLKGLFGDKKMSDCPVPLYLVAMDIKRYVPKVFDRTDDIFVWEAVLASMSAPTYFPQYKDYVDGGLGFNNPTLCTLAGLVKEGYDVTRDKICVMSISSNGNFPQSHDTRGKTILGNIEPLLSLTMAGTEVGTAYIVDQFLGSKHLRIDPWIEKGFALDSVSEAPRLIQKWTEWTTANDDLVIDFFVKNGLYDNF